MRLLALLAVAVLLTVVQAHAQVYEPYDGYDDYGSYEYDDPYSPYPPPPYYDPAPRYQEPLYDRRERSARSARGTIVIATREHTLIYTRSSGEQFAYPIAVGREGKQWYGSTRVVSKRMHPEWRPTASMRQKNPRLPAVVRAGPANPLGTRAIYLADGLLRIHGTNDPASIGTNASSGCFRMYREDVEELYDMVQPGTRVIVQR
ncbi:L,D-transpeptidase [Rhizobium leguminosarum bv. trifolii]|uniref:L,D-transpeptidase n=1 Tax=Rhizobium leguminosarum bv. trifolii TaxID=386 RepID=A0A3E1AZJ1_RHILT|nr:MULTISPECIES: L,D-transpeptidase [Rhizobium]ANM14257.1 L,D-transpeptidase domain-containing protein [Rhizobium sp. N324]ANM20641.1 L,D-transpeptidase domain-containing protein [Rhizobium sp. N541]ANM27025.1 L,D-transpeptidase domain-containing protein [Rhizobium sp. N941]OYD00430.1 L,D-transpeptidase domain-containing protein [Rhizobium sp. N4311]RFB82414.1 L,D-transpeptidase [Rhizobium leguminosarum bv. trifolii]